MQYETPYQEPLIIEDQPAGRRSFMVALPPLAAMLFCLVMVAMIAGAVKPQPAAASAAALPASAVEFNAAAGASGVEAAAQSAPQPAAVGASDLAGFFMPSVLYWSDSIRAWAAQAGLDPNLVATVMQIESCGDPQAMSSAGASGLFQVMPFHFAAGEDSLDPDTNAKRGVAYLKKSLDTAGGDARLAFAGYNGGIGVIAREAGAWAAETQRYARWGEGIYSEASTGSAESDTLQAWLSSGGASLCRQASARLGLTE